MKMILCVIGHKIIPIAYFYQSYFLRCPIIYVASFNLKSLPIKTSNNVCSHRFLVPPQRSCFICAVAKR